MKKIQIPKPSGKASGIVPPRFLLLFCYCVSYSLLQTCVLNKLTFLLTLTNLHSFAARAASLYFIMFISKYRAASQ